MRRIRGRMILFSMLVSIVLCSCSGLNDKKEGGATGIFEDKDEKYANGKFEDIVSAIEEKDKDKIISMFSDKIKSNFVDGEVNVDKLFDFIDGEVQKWEKRGGPGVSESVNNGEKIKIINSYYNLYTTEETYFFFIEDSQINTADTNNEGLTLILVVKEEDRMKIYDDNQKILFDNGKKLSPYGVCIPFYESKK